MNRFYLAPESEAMFRRVSHSRVISHVAKKCKCGKQATAKQLAQYGHCVSCQKAAAKPPLNIVFLSGHRDFLKPDNSDRRFWPVPITPKKARKA